MPQLQVGRGMLMRGTISFMNSSKRVFLKIVFVKTIHNKSDMFTKNVCGDIYQSHVDSYIMKREDVAAYVSSVSEKGCWSIDDRYRTNISPVLLHRVEARYTGVTGRVPEPLSDTPETSEYGLGSTQVVQGSGLGDYSEDWEHQCQGFLPTLHTGSNRNDIRTLGTRPDETGDVVMGMKHP